MLNISYYGPSAMGAHEPEMIEHITLKGLFNSLMFAAILLPLIVWLGKSCRTGALLRGRSPRARKAAAYSQEQQYVMSKPIARAHERPDSGQAVYSAQPHLSSHPVSREVQQDSSRRISKALGSTTVDYRLADEPRHNSQRTPRSFGQPVDPFQRIHGASSEHSAVIDTAASVPTPEPPHPPSRYDLRLPKTPARIEEATYEDFGDGPGMEETIVDTADEGSDYDPSASSSSSWTSTRTSGARTWLADTMRSAFLSRPMKFVGDLHEWQQADADKIAAQESELNEALAQDGIDPLQRGHILMYDMGLGKTVVSIYVIYKSAVEARRRGRPTLVVCPNFSLLLQWKHMFEKFSRNVKLLVYHDDIPGFTKPGAESLKYYDVVLATYSQLSRQRNVMNNADGAVSSDGLDWSLLLVEWYRVILDESHEVRKWNPKAVGKQVQAVMELQKLHGLCLTGTPMQNAPSDLYPQLRFLGLRYEELMRRDRFFPNAFQLESYELQALGSNRPEMFLDILKKTCIRREYVTRSGNSLAEMPLKTESREVVPLTLHERSLYNRVEEIFVDEEPFVRIMRQRQACVMPHLLSALITEEYEEDTADSITVDQDEDPDVSASITASMQPAHYRSPAHISLQRLPPELQGLLTAQYVPSKITHALDIIRRHRFAPIDTDGSDKILVFSWFKGTVRLMSEKLQAQGIDHVTFNGDTKDKSRSLTKINTDPNCSVILMSIQAGGVGLDLTCCNVVLFLERWWNPYVEDQAVARVWRIGQRKPVKIYKLIACDTIEAIEILETQERKKAGVEAVLQYLQK